MVKWYFVFIGLLCCLNVNAQKDVEIKGPIEYVYDSTKNVSLKAHVFFPSDKQLKKVNPAIIIFHGGGWSMGDPSWAYDTASGYAKKGMVAVTAQYRLSDQKNNTPIDAIDDARNAIIWLRKNANELKIARDSIVAYGWSAGAHLASSTAIFSSIDSISNISSIPNALVLFSPALSLKKDEWFKKLLLNRAKPLDYSPAENLRENMPPSIIVVGKDDTVTPIQQSQLFHKNMLKYGNKSSIHIFDGVGHLFTPSNQSDKGYPNPDKKIEAKAMCQIDLFLKELGYID